MQSPASSELWLAGSTSPTAGSELWLAGMWHVTEECTDVYVSVNYDWRLAAYTTCAGLVFVYLLTWSFWLLVCFPFSTTYDVPKSARSLRTGEPFAEYLYSGWPDLACGFSDLKMTGLLYWSLSAFGGRERHILYYTHFLHFLLADGYGAAGLTWYFWCSTRKTNSSIGNSRTISCRCTTRAPRSRNRNYWLVISPWFPVATCS